MSKHASETVELDARGMAVALDASRSSPCVRRQVGAAVYTAEGVLLATGFNRGPQMQSACFLGGCPRAASGVEPLTTSYSEGPGKCHAIHAEEVAWLKVGWDNLRGCTTYVNSDLCFNCLRLAANLPLARIVTPNRIYTPKDFQ